MARFVIAVTLLLAAVVIPALVRGLSADSRSPDFQKLLPTLGKALSSLTSEAEAQALFLSTLVRPLELGVVAEQVKHAAGTAQSFAEEGGKLSAELAAWHLAIELRQAADLTNSAPLAALKPRIDRQQWLLEQRPSLRRAARLLTALTVPPVIAGSGDAEQFRSYAGYLDRTYPDLAGTDQSWVHVAEERGEAGLSRRLLEFWQDEPANRIQHEMASQYFESRLRPVLTASLVAHAVRSEADAQQLARQHWMTLREWVDTMRHRKGLTRLCGTWQWTVHNHQNHQDHKATISFPSPEAWEARDGLRPSQAVVHGDSVYLRWEFQGGVQEDSLLFGKDGLRLEGTFINSAGAWGSISGKRVSSCPTHKPATSP